jgi:hypothetical protein
MTAAASTLLVGHLVMQVVTLRLGPDAPAGGGFLKLRETPGPWEAASSGFGMTSCLWSGHLGCRLATGRHL